MTRASLLALTAAAATLALPRATTASSCQETSFKQQMTAADVIFIGRALEIDAELATTFDVVKIYKGDVPARVIVETGRVKYAMLSPPGNYVVLATRDEQAKPGNLFVHQCSGSQREPYPAGLLEQLGEGKPPSPAPTPPAEPTPAPTTVTPPKPAPAPGPTSPPPIPARGCTIDDTPHTPFALLLALLLRRRGRTGRQQITGHRKNISDLGPA